MFWQKIFQVFAQFGIYSCSYLHHPKNNEMQIFVLYSYFSPQKVNEWIRLIYHLFALKWQKKLLYIFFSSNVLLSLDKLNNLSIDLKIPNLDIRRAGKVFPLKFLPLKDKRKGNSIIQHLKLFSAFVKCEVICKSIFFQQNVNKREKYYLMELRIQLSYYLNLKKN